MKHNLEIENLCKQYPHFSLKDISFHIPNGFIMGVIGPNGAGKTTTIKSVLQMIAPDSGEIRLFGRTVSPDSIRFKEDVGVVMDLPFYPDDWTVRDVQSALSLFYTNWNHDQYNGYLHRFGIDRRKKVKELSRGMKVKLMLASALSHDAKLLVLDEPTSGLDPVARDELMDILLGFVADAEKSVLFSTHITTDLEKIADYITFIRDGAVQFSGEKDDLLEKYALVKGGVSELSAAQKKTIIGYRQHSAGFDGMIQTEQIKELPQSVYTEKITLDEIIVYMNRGGTDCA